MAARDRDFAASVADRLVALGPVRARGMFGGHGIMLDNVMFGLVWRGRLFFKTDETNRADYVRARSEPFAYMRGCKRVETSHMEVPKKVQADPARLAAWGERALAVAREKKKKARKR
jgi:DNA transformation protein